jgi:hypothetical protein
MDLAIPRPCLLAGECVAVRITDAVSSAPRFTTKSTKNHEGARRKANKFNRYVLFLANVRGSTTKMRSARCAVAGVFHLRAPSWFFVSFVVKILLACGRAEPPANTVLLPSGPSSFIPRHGSASKTLRKAPSRTRVPSALFLALLNFEWITRRWD